ncbi:hypothetical protein PSTG_13336 [Puccinia striiformis f. sp. tritici PST-78]|uniref:Uncharacterized protein n=1 Tax=Puccinia striiformis f. sp. tritici PST-78 TaxID=1165861 RepID=A0A0L0V289_9BASI|nr:hypothetical protein PSTG_13336 [Puccinia striiformis f. sp. tritici PST-78]
MVLKDLLEDHEALYNSKHVTSTNKLGILLHMLITGLSNRKLQQRFQQSASTILITINQLVKDITSNRALIRKFITLPAHDAKTPNKIKSNSKFSPYFDNCIGAVDGSHIPVHVNNQTPFVNRKGYPSQNTLAICNFNMEFMFVMPGWEGSAHDGRLWDEAWSSSLKIPDGKWLLGNAGYPLSESCLVSILSNQISLERPGCCWGEKTYQELFDLRHNSACNVIEQIFGVIKSRFEVINTGCYYNISIQLKVIIVMAFIHNFIQVTDPTDTLSSDEISTSLDDCQPATVEYIQLYHQGITRRESTKATKMRDEIAKRMWLDYQNLIRSCQRHSQPDTCHSCLILST